MADLDHRQLARRLKLARQGLFGVHGAPELARRLGIPTGTWLNYEGGVAIPGLVLLQFIDLTGVDPHWLATGEGPIPGEHSATTLLDSAEPVRSASLYGTGHSHN